MFRVIALAVLLIPLGCRSTGGNTLAGNAGWMESKRPKLNISFEDMTEDEVVSTCISELEREHPTYRAETEAKAACSKIKNKYQFQCFIASIHNRESRMTGAHIEACRKISTEISLECVKATSFHKWTPLSPEHIYNCATFTTQSEMQCLTYVQRNKKVRIKVAHQNA